MKFFLTFLFISLIFQQNKVQSHLNKPNYKLDKIIQNSQVKLLQSNQQRLNKSRSKDKQKNNIKNQNFANSDHKNQPIIFQAQLLHSGLKSSQQTKSINKLDKKKHSQKTFQYLRHQNYRDQSLLPSSYINKTLSSFPIPPNFKGFKTKEIISSNHCELKQTFSSALKQQFQINVKQQILQNQHNILKNRKFRQPPQPPSRANKPSLASFSLPSINKVSFFSSPSSFLSSNVHFDFQATDKPLSSTISSLSVSRPLINRISSPPPDFIPPSPIKKVQHKLFSLPSQTTNSLQSFVISTPIFSSPISIHSQQHSLHKQLKNKSLKAGNKIIFQKPQRKHQQQQNYQIKNKKQVKQVIQVKQVRQVKQVKQIKQVQFFKKDIKEIDTLYDHFAQKNKDIKKKRNLSSSQSMKEKSKKQKQKSLYRWTSSDNLNNINSFNFTPIDRKIKQKNTFNIKQKPNIQPTQTLLNIIEKAENPILKLLPANKQHLKRQTKITNKNQFYGRKISSSMQYENKQKTYQQTNAGNSQKIQNNKQKNKLSQDIIKTKKKKNQQEQQINNKKQWYKNNNNGQKQLKNKLENKQLQSKKTGNQMNFNFSSKIKKGNQISSLIKPLLSIKSASLKKKQIKKNKKDLIQQRKRAINQMLNQKVSQVIQLPYYI